jgi:hypothetical protein
MIYHPYINPLEVTRDEAWILFEKYWNHGSPSGFRSTLPDPYAPDSIPGIFNLAIEELSWDDVVRVGTYPPSMMPSSSSTELFPIHPITQDDLGGRLENINSSLLCTATSSGRTVALLSEDSLKIEAFVKLSVDKKIGRFSRRLELFKWMSSLQIGAELSITAQKFPVDIHFLPENGGVFSRNRGFGSIFRDPDPYPLVLDIPECDQIIIPAFSLLFQPESDEKRLITELFHDCKTYDTPLVCMIFPLVDAYCYMALRRGLLFECNAQNVLFVLNRSNPYRPWKVVFRDFADVFIDLDIRRQLNIPSNFVRYKLLHDTTVECEYDLFERRSFSFDFKLGTYILAPLINAISSALDISKLYLFQETRHRADMWFRGMDYFGGMTGWYRYANSAKVTRFDYEYIGTPPLFRNV